ncbi:hypothetical protein P691DRAFT_724970 [Macrolepiota fuliginosa MF-IS2]|uniref:Heme haloperoxidase family profile domain-containing protein n=1 Tax=Macrolepiota fuliginosa MF-IS2 TaxID=1400762 RepID=A0A9P5XGJ6_9AGAR|nr:hypothetical protein P691DRAFT_724970 [Macrolepiota fuliginosa MF-IS2]
MTSSPNVTPSPRRVKDLPKDCEYLPPTDPSQSRSPCPALNTLANHGYIPRDGKDVGFFEVINALQYVYNLTWILAFFLAAVGFYISGKVKFSTVSKESTSSNSMLVWARRFIPLPHWTLDLTSLSVRGPENLAHNGSLVHPNNISSHTPDKRLLAKLLAFASPCYRRPCPRGLSLADLARYHDKREKELPHPLNSLHKKVALGECGLAWAVMRRRHSTERKRSGENGDEFEEVITEDSLRTWFGCERLPEDWWVDGGSRPTKSIGLFEAQRRAGDVAKLIAKGST